MPAPFPSEFPWEAGGLAARQPKPIGLLAQDSGALQSGLCPWMAQADIDESVEEASTASLLKEPRRLRKGNRVAGTECDHPNDPLDPSPGRGSGGRDLSARGYEQGPVFIPFVAYPVRRRHGNPRRQQTPRAGAKPTAMPARKSREAALRLPLVEVDVTVGQDRFDAFDSCLQFADPLGVGDALIQPYGSPTIADRPDGAVGTELLCGAVDA